MKRYFHVNTDGSRVWLEHSNDAGGLDPWTEVDKDDAEAPAFIYDREALAARQRNALDIERRIQQDETRLKAALEELEKAATRIRELEVELDRWKPVPHRERAPLERSEVEARRLGKLLKDAMPLGWGFFLGLFTFGEGGFATYISTAERGDTVRLMRELAGKIERGDPLA